MAFALLLAWTFVLVARPQDFFPALAGLRPALSLGLVTLAAALLTRNGMRIAGLLQLKEPRRYLLFYLVLIAGVPFSLYRAQALKFILFGYLSNMLFYFLVLAQADSLKKIRGLLTTVGWSVLFYACFSLLQGKFLKGRLFAGTMYDPNDLAFFLVSLFPLSFFFIVRDHGILKKAVAMATIGIAIGAIILTGSRGGLVGLFVLFTALFFVKTGNPVSKPAHKAVLVLIALAAVLFQASKINVQRYATLGELGRDYNVTDEEGRLAIWKRALQLIARNPLFGVGAGCFPQAIGELRQSQGGSPNWQVSHNAYLQIAAEAGLPGFVLFLSVAAAAYRNFAGAKGLVRGSPASADVNAVAGTLALGYLACLTTAFFLSQGYSILFTLFFALAVAVRRQHQAAAAPSAAPAGVRAGTAAGGLTGRVRFLPESKSPEPEEGIGK